MILTRESSDDEHFREEFSRTDVVTTHFVDAHLRKSENHSTHWKKPADNVTGYGGFPVSGEARRENDMEEGKNDSDTDGNTTEVR
uniref:Uncharacterized protein n=1 Tax=Cucumis sativus TaxID=3659 RepID=A0A0A0KYW5_CUCSA